MTRVTSAGQKGFAGTQAQSGGERIQGVGGDDGGMDDPRTGHYNVFVSLSSAEVCAEVLIKVAQCHWHPPPTKIDLLSVNTVELPLHAVRAAWSGECKVTCPQGLRICVALQ